MSICILDKYERNCVYWCKCGFLLTKIFFNCSFNAGCSFLGCLSINSFVKLTRELYTSNCSSVIRYSSMDVNLLSFDREIISKYKKAKNDFMMQYGFLAKDYDR